MERLQREAAGAIVRLTSDGGRGGNQLDTGRLPAASLASCRALARRLALECNSAKYVAGCAEQGTVLNGPASQLLDYWV